MIISMRFVSTLRALRSPAVIYLQTSSSSNKLIISNKVILFVITAVDFVNKSSIKSLPFTIDASFFSYCLFYGTRLDAMKKININ